MVVYMNSIIILISTLFLIRGLNAFNPKIKIEKEFVLYDIATQGLDANTVCFNKFGTSAATIYNDEENAKAVKLYIIYIIYIIYIYFFM